jgi:hypothetical protein
MSYYAFFNKSEEEIKFGYDTFLSSNLVIGATSNVTGDRVLLVNEKVVPLGGLQCSMRLQEMDPEHRGVKVVLASSNLRELELGVYSYSNNSNAYVRVSGGDLGVESGGRERMRFMREGNIGVGTGVGLAPFHVGVSALFSGSNSVESSLVVRNSGGGPGLSIVATNLGENSVFRCVGSNGVAGLEFLSDGDLRYTQLGSNSCFSIGTGRSVTQGTIVDVNGNLIVTGNIGIGTTSTGHTLQVQGDIYASGTLYQANLNQAIFSLVTSSTSGGGSSTGNLYVTRAINTVNYNDIPGVSLNTGNGQITLPAGKYHIKANSMAFNCGYNRLRLFNISNTSVVAYGTSHFAGTSNQVSAELEVIHSPVTTFNYILQHYTQNSVAGNGFGVYDSTHAGAYLGTNSYVLVHVDKLA